MPSVIMALLLHDCTSAAACKRLYAMLAHAQRSRPRPRHDADVAMAVTPRLLKALLLPAQPACAMAARRGAAPRGGGAQQASASARRRRRERRRVSSPRITP